METRDKSSGDKVDSVSAEQECLKVCSNVATVSQELDSGLYFLIYERWLFRQCESIPRKNRKTQSGQELSLSDIKAKVSPLLLEKIECSVLRPSNGSDVQQFESES